MGYSKMETKCKKCKFKDTCNNKRMMAMASLSLPNTTSLSQPMGIKYTPITIKLGQNEEVQTSMEDIKKQMEKEFYKKAGLGVINIKK